MKDETGRNADLPRSLEVLWRRADRRRGAAKQALSLERIVAAAIEVADAEGLAGLSMARVAEKLACATMSLYRHVPSKDDLLVFMMDAAPGEPPDLSTAKGDWRAGLERWAHELRVVYLRHPWVLQIAGTSPPLEPGQLAWLDRGLATLRTTRLHPAEKLGVIMLVLFYVRGEAQLAAGRGQGGPPDGAGDREVLARYGRTIAQLIEPERFPALAEAIAAGVFDPSRDETGAADHFAFGLARVLDGIAVLEGARR